MFSIIYLEKNPNQFSILVKDLREKQGISQRELSRQLGLSLMMVRDWENGTKLPSIQTLQKFAEYFEQDYDKLAALILSVKRNVKTYTKLYQKRV